MQTWNGERVQIAFVLDCCDSEVIAFTAIASFVDGEMIRGLRLAAVERRFGPEVWGLPRSSG